MESLAFFISILLSITLLSGPISIALSSKLARSITSNSAAKVLRRVLMILVSALGLLVSFFFMFTEIPLLLKTISLCSILANVWSIDREYGGRLMNRLKFALGRPA